MDLRKTQPWVWVPKGCRVVRVIGEGAFGVVILVCHISTKEEFVVKVTKLGTSNLELARQERDILRGLKHQNVVRLLGATEEGGRLFMAFPYVSGGDLRNYLDTNGPMVEEEARRVFLQLTSALHYCHSQGVAHRDLKPENILMDSREGRVFISDFGLAHYFLRRPMRSFCGTPGYIAPEVIFGGIYGPGVDLWSLAIILHELLKGHGPFDPAEAGCSNTLSSSVQHLLEGMLQVNPRRRMGWTQLLSHPWVTQGSGPIGVHLEPEPAVESIPSSMPFALIPRQRCVSAPPAAVAKARKPGSPSRSSSPSDISSWSLASASPEPSGQLHCHKAWQSQEDSERLPACLLLLLLSVRQERPHPPSQRMRVSLTRLVLPQVSSHSRKGVGIVALPVLSGSSNRMM
ncbi:MAP/microtubule affinity-regulating kinase 4-like [Erinaceus europaeus]|uniref:non-specific serine/threonine protein kinase n=1 Tax=Erinaceus europaeus TaxID=9365 RepID=A0ABM3WEY6_ERIEU|nr:MAP/microtubule affinity-regulating kinase 4-like [Erinaceus europaeus]